MLKSILCLCLCLFITACDASDSPRYPDKFKNKGQYYFKDCSLKVVFNWGDNNNVVDRYRIIMKINNKIGKPALSLNFPFFENGSRHPFNSYLFYYVNYCEDKEKITKEIVETYLKDIEGFPPYRIEKIEWEDYKNAVPIGSWIDQ